MSLGRAVLVAVALLAGPAGAACVIEAARYAAPTDRYRHGVFGRPWEWAALEITRGGPGCAAGRETLRLDLPDAFVFEDTEPRLIDLDGRGGAEVVTVETRRDMGARLVVWGLREDRPVRIAATPNIGRAQRWLAPLGAADLDGDGRIELAWIDRPHLARILTVWRYDAGRLVPVATAQGHTNHRFGEGRITGGIRACPDRGTRLPDGPRGEPRENPERGADGPADPSPRIVTTDAGRDRLLLTRLDAGQLITTDAGPYSEAAMAAALACRS